METAYIYCGRYNRSLGQIKLRLTFISESLFRPYRKLKNKKASVRETDAKFSQIFSLFT